MAISDMSFEKEYLMHVIPRLNDAQVRELISLLNGGKPQAAKKAAAAGSDPYAELMDMIGCDNAKEQISALIAAHRMKQIAEKRNHKTARQHFHLAFIGSEQVCLL